MLDKRLHLGSGDIEVWETVRYTNTVIGSKSKPEYIEVNGYDKDLVMRSSFTFPFPNREFVVGNVMLVCGDVPGPIEFNKKGGALRIYCLQTGELLKSISRQAFNVQSIFGKSSGTWVPMGVSDDLDRLLVLQEDELWVVDVSDKPKLLHKLVTLESCQAIQAVLFFSGSWVIVIKSAHRSIADVYSESNGKKVQRLFAIDDVNMVTPVQYGAFAISTKEGGVFLCNLKSNHTEQVKTPSFNFQPFIAISETTREIACRDINSGRIYRLSVMNEPALQFEGEFGWEEEMGQEYLPPFIYLKDRLIAVNKGGICKRPTRPLSRLILAQGQQFVDATIGP